jgi:hypothetical protein
VLPRDRNFGSQNTKLAKQIVGPEKSGAKFLPVFARRAKKMLYAIFVVHKTS